MIKQVSAMDVRKRFGDLLNEVHYKGDSVVITKAGKPMGALVSVELFERIRVMEDEFKRMTDELAQAYADVDPNTTQAEIDEAIEATRQEQ